MLYTDMNSNINAGVGHLGNSMIRNGYQNEHMVTPVSSK